MYARISCLVYYYNYIIIDTDITFNMNVSQQGFCIDVALSNPSIALPKVNRNERDCTCSLIIPEEDESNCYDVRQCSCINSTMFAETFTNCESRSQSNSFHLCFSNLSTEMNNTLIFFFETLYRCYGTVRYRAYRESFKIVIGRYILRYT